MSKQIQLSEIKGLSFIGGQITSRIEADEKRNERVIGKVKVIPPKAIKAGKIVQFSAGVHPETSRRLCGFFAFRISPVRKFQSHPAVFILAVRH